MMRVLMVCFGVLFLVGCESYRGAKTKIVEGTVAEKVEHDDLFAGAYIRGPCALTGGAATRILTPDELQMWLVWLPTFCAKPGDVSGSLIPSLIPAALP